MTLRRMIDAAYLPTTLQQVQTIRSITGASVAVVYVPGWGEPYHATPVAQAKMLVQAGMMLLPLLVPAPDGGDLTVDECAQGIQVTKEYMAQVGVTGTLVGMDFEAGWFAAKPVPVCNSQVSFTIAGNDQGVTSCPYLSPSNAIGLSQRQVRPNCIWVASWINTVPSSVTSIPGVPDALWSSPGQRAWQYQGGHLVDGDNLDMSLSELSGYWVPTPTPDPAPPTTSTTTVTVPVSWLEGLLNEIKGYLP